MTIGDEQQTVLEVEKTGLVRRLTDGDELLTDRDEQLTDLEVQ